MEGADHDIGDDAVGHQRAHDADMGKAARGAAAKREPDDRPPNAAEPTFSPSSSPFWPRRVKISSTADLLEPAPQRCGRKTLPALRICATD